MKTKIKRGCWGVAGVIGYILSPLSWWNDLWVNIPIAYVAGCGAAWINPGLFTPVFAATYLATNVVGMILLQLGIQGASKVPIEPLTRRALIKWTLITIGYTAIIVMLSLTGFIRPATDYLK